MLTFRCYGDKEEIESRLYELRPGLNFTVVNSCMDNAVCLEDIDEDGFYDILEELDDLVYNDEDISLEATFVQFMLSNNLIVSVAESCTGGLLSAAIVSISGASKIFYEGIVAYSNDAKIDRLGVSEETLAEYGAVSAQTAREMAYGLLGGEAEIAISVTGIAGPDGGSEEKPVGLVYIGIAGNGREPAAIENYFAGSREQIRKSAKNACLFYALQFLRQNY